MRIAFLGNFSVSFTTENHLAGSFELLGHTVTRIQEGDVRAEDIPALVASHDLFVHTQTYNLAVRAGTESERAQMYDQIHAAGIPMVGIHLDKWVSLQRETQLTTDPYFTHLGHLGTMFTADGGNQARFTQLGINHHWLPPGVFAPECVLGQLVPQFRSPIAFVGNWRGKYHPESRHRHELITWLQRTFRQQVNFWPKGQSIRGQQLSDLYASVQIVVGDSCFSGDERGRSYISDRIPECLGRGGFLLHPYTEGIDDLFTDGKHLVYYEPFNWTDLRDKITYYLNHKVERDEIRLAGFEHVKAMHTYTHRVQAVLDVLAPEFARRHARESIELRPNTTDADIHAEIFDEQVYRAAPHIHLGDIVVDLGANVGMFTVYAASLGARVIAVEPFPENLPQLQKNVTAAGFSDQVEAMPYACGDRNGECVIIAGDTEAGRGRDAWVASETTYTDLPGGEGLFVPMVDLDTLLTPYDEVAMLKLDVEGAEYPIFAAASESTMKKIAYIAMEFHGDATDMLHGRKLIPGSVGRLLEKIGETHGIVTLGKFSVGGYFYCTRF